MRTQKLIALALLALVVSPLAALVSPPPPVQAQQAFASPAFASLWDRTDSLVANQVVTNRSWYWGPGPGRSGVEPYAQGRGGVRLVQYFDKARMEINHPEGDPNAAGFVTTGLLVTDLVSGNFQVGDNQFVARGPADIVIAGDADDLRAPTYASFRGVASLNNNNRASKQIGARVTSTINRAGQVGVDVTKAGDPGARITAYSDVFGHNVPDAIWQFMNQAGVVRINGQPTVDRPVINWIFTIGYPTTEAFWARVKIGGQPTDVLIQLFQRRALVYIPSYRAPWNVQMANVGIHYYQWLYGQNGGPPPVAGTPVAPTPTRPPLPPTAVRPPPPPTLPVPTATPPRLPPPPTLPAPTVPPTVPPPPPPTVAPPTPTSGTIPPSVDGSVAPLNGPPGTVFLARVSDFEVRELVVATLTSPGGAVVDFPLPNRPSPPQGQIANIAIDSSGFQGGVWVLAVTGTSSKHTSLVYFRVDAPAPPPPPPPPPAATNTPVPPPPPPAATNTPVPAPTKTPVPAPQGPLTVSPPSGNRTTLFTFVGTGFNAGEQVVNWFIDPSGRFWYPSGGQTLTSTSAGQVSLQVVPSNAFNAVATGTWTFHLHAVSSGKDEVVSFLIQ